MNTSNWEKGFRKTIIDLDDLNHRFTIDAPVKGDIYFDGIEIEQYVRNLLTSERTKIREMVESRMDVQLANATGPMDDETYALKLVAIVKNQTLQDILQALQAGDNDTGV